MDEADFMKLRVEDQISWYDKKSRFNQSWYKGLRICEISLSLSIPLLTAVVPDGWANKVVVGSVGIIVAVTAGVLLLFKFQENWIQYRTAAETLKHEKFLFLTGAGPYNNAENAFPIFVERIESLISKENANWAQYVKKEDKRAEENS
ncbi:MAG: DUF4231 domain-containing protein [Clostridiales bacterium]|jgi:hypothetical protein|nr:DUF4231 domain-containing protein [Eubacteriales bacterium]MDH7567575.1 DUF4231 domain-containing protein [Clostridiales bacterium]